MASKQQRIVGVWEIAQMAGVSPKRADQITHNRGFPAPYDELRMGRVWRYDDVAAYLQEREERRRGVPAPVPRRPRPAAE